jgi:peptidoglycan hydrolase CwlO-like protein
MASAESLKVTHNVDAKVMGVDDRVRDVEGKVEDVQDDVQDVGNKVENVDGRVQDVQGEVHDVGNKVENVDGRVQDVQGEMHDVGNKVQDVDNRVQGIGSDVNDISCEVREVNRSLSLYPLLVVMSAQTMTQGISSEIVFYDGFRRQTHPSIITLPPKLITMVQPNGFFKAIYLINGNLRVHSCGYMGSVCHS